MGSALSLSSAAISWIDQEENYGRHVVRSFLERCAPYGHVLDVGAGCGNDLAIARDVCPEAVCHAIECFPRNVTALEKHHQAQVGLQQVVLGPLRAEIGRASCRERV